MADDHARAREIFAAAVRLPREERNAFLAVECQASEELRAEVEELLRFHDEDDLGMETPLPSSTVSPPTPQAVGDFRLLKKVGEGGMGEVYEAEQLRPVRRRVALKVIRWGMASKEVLARFEAERQALALMSNPTIARVLDAGATEDGRPYFAMEYVKGVPITEYCETHRSSLRERLELFVRVCRGVQHAHQKGVIHRDLKPSNVLVTVEEGSPAPKIIDFGVAKATAQRLTERTVYTELGQWIGTPEYMSPEQAEMTVLDIDTRTDVYSLGVMLYELLVGAQPFDSTTLRRAGFDEMRRIIREEDPPRPSTRVSASDAELRQRGMDRRRLARVLRGDLDWITMKALEKDRVRRYDSPAELAADVERHLAHQPVVAGPPGMGYQLGKFVRRNRLTVTAASVIAVAVVLGVIGTAVGFLRAQSEAEAARRVSNVLVSMYGDLNPSIMRGAVSTTEDILARAVERVDGELDHDPLVQARLLATVGHVYKDLGELDRAKPLLERSAEIRRSRLGDGHPDYAMSISILGDLLVDMGDLEQARELHSLALAIRRAALGGHHPTVGWSLRSLGNTDRVMGRLESARENLQLSLDVLETVSAPDPYDVSKTLHLLALVAMEVGDFADASELLRRCLNIREEQLGPHHPEVAEILRDLARALFRLDVPMEPVEITQRALSISKQALGSDHVVTVSTKAQLAVLKLAEGETRAAEALYDEILESERRTGRSFLSDFRRYPEFLALEEAVGPGDRDN